MSKLITTNKNLNLKTIDLDNPKEIKNITFLSAENKIDELRELKAYQRLLRLTDCEESSLALLEQNVHSVFNITDMARTTFVKEYAQFCKENGKTSKQKAGDIYDKAVAKKNQVVNTYVAIAQHKSPFYTKTRFDNLSQVTNQNFNNVPSYQDLFGEVDFCSCPECRTIFSPAAYFVDLMSMQSKYILQPNEELKLTTRRPDLEQIELNCENTNELVPTISIVNDVLIKSINNANTNYETLNEAVYPFNLPFNKPLSDIKTFLKSADLSLFSIWKKLNNKVFFEIPNKDIYFNILGITQNQWNIFITNLDSTKELSKYYGYKTDNTTLIADLTPIDTFLERTQLTYPELNELLFENLSCAQIKEKIPLNFFINSGETKFLQTNTQEAICEQTNNPKREKLVNLNIKKLSNINRFVRLSKAIGFCFIELDWALRTIGFITKGEDKAILDENSLKYLAWFKQIKQNNPKLSIEEICAIQGLIKDYGDKNNKNSLFDKIYNNKNIPNPPSWYHIEDGIKSFSLIWKVPSLGSSDVNEQTQQIQAALIAALKISEVELILIAQQMLDGKEELELSLANLSILYRFSLLPKVLKLSIEEIFTALSFSNINDSEKTIVACSKNLQNLLIWLEEFSLWSKSLSLNTYQIQYLLTGESEDSKIRNQIINEELFRNFKEELLEELETTLIDEESLRVALGVYGDYNQYSVEAQKFIFKYLDDSDLENKVKSIFPTFNSSNPTTENTRADDLYKRILVYRNIQDIEKSIDTFIKETKDAFAQAMSSDYLLAYLIEKLEKKEYIDSLGIIDNIDNIDNIESKGSFFKNLLFCEQLDGEVSSTFTTLNTKFEEIIPPFLETNYEIQQSVYKNFISNFLNMEPNTFDLIVKNLTIENDQSLMIKDFICIDNTTQSFTLKALQKLQRYAVLINIFNLSELDVASIISSTLQYKYTSNEISIDFINSLYNYKSLQIKFNDQQNLFSSLINTKEEKEEKYTSNLIKDLNAITQWNKKELAFLLDKLDFTLPITIDAISTLNNWFNFSEKSNLDISTIYKIYELSKKNNFEYKKVEELSFSIWSGLVKNYENKADELTNIKASTEVLTRNYLAPYVLNEKRADENFAINNLRDLSNYLLIDIEVGAEVETSLIKSAISTVQMYIYRCLNNLEKNIDVLDSFESWWEWMANYRVWEANRKVFIFPENYLEPELRTDKTPLFTQLETNLQQVDLKNTANIETAVNSYLDAFSELADLDIVSSAGYDYTTFVNTGNVEDDSNVMEKESFKNFCFIGKKKDEVSSYYYRFAKFIKQEKEKGKIEYIPVDWLPWNEINTTFQAIGKVKPFFAFGKWFIFWVEQIQTSTKTEEQDEKEVEVPQHTIYIKSSYLNLNNEWTVPKTLESFEDNTYYELSDEEEGKVLTPEETKELANLKDELKAEKEKLKKEEAKLVQFLKLDAELIFNSDSLEKKKKEKDFCQKKIEIEEKVDNDINITDGPAGLGLTTKIILNADIESLTKKIEELDIEIKFLEVEVESLTKKLKQFNINSIEQNIETYNEKIKELKNKIYLLELLVSYSEVTISFLDSINILTVSYGESEDKIFKYGENFLCHSLTFSSKYISKHLPYIIYQNNQAREDYKYWSTFDMFKEEPVDNNSSSLDKKIKDTKTFSTWLYQEKGEDQNLLQISDDTTIKIQSNHLYIDDIDTDIALENKDWTHLSVRIEKGVNGYPEILADNKELVPKYNSYSFLNTNKTTMICYKNYNSKDNCTYIYIGKVNDMYDKTNLELFTLPNYSYSNSNLEIFEYKEEYYLCWLETDVRDLKYKEGEYYVRFGKIDFTEKKIIEMRNLATSTVYSYTTFDNGKNISNFVIPPSFVKYNDKYYLSYTNFEDKKIKLINFSIKNSLIKIVKEDNIEIESFNNDDILTSPKLMVNNLENKLYMLIQNTAQNCLANIILDSGELKIEDPFIEKATKETPYEILSYVEPREKIYFYMSRQWGARLYKIEKSELIYLDNIDNGHHYALIYSDKLITTSYFTKEYSSDGYSYLYFDIVDNFSIFINGLQKYSENFFKKSSVKLNSELKEISMQESYFFSDSLNEELVKELYNNSKSYITKGYTDIANSAKNYMNASPIAVDGEPGWQRYDSQGISLLCSINNLQTILQMNCYRLNTTAIDKLIEDLYLKGINKLLSLDSQYAKEIPFEILSPDNNSIPMGTWPSDTIDFMSSPMSMYYWEIFFYMPYLIAKSLQTAQQNSFAKKWYEYIFNPTINLTHADSINPAYKFDKYWRFLALRSSYNTILEEELSRPWSDEIKEATKQDSVQLYAYHNNPFEPHVIAKARPIAYQKNIVMHYIDNLITWGDKLFREYTVESIVEATINYMTAYDLLGESPTYLGECPLSKSVDLAKFVENYDGLTNIPEFLIEFERKTSKSLPIFRSNGVPSTYVPNLYFNLPENEQLIDYWDVVQERLFNIRHSLNIDGVRQKLALFEPAINPAQLVAQIGSGGSLSSRKSFLNATIPYYRFSVVLQLAKSTTQNVIQFGQSLLGALDKKDAEKLNLLQNQHQVILLQQSTGAKQAQVESIEQTIESLQYSLKGAQDRDSHYTKLIDKGLSELEESQLDLSISAGAISAVGAGFRGISAPVYGTVPTIFGFAIGGQNVGKSIEIGALIADATAAGLNQSASIVGTYASYERRAQDWELQQTLAQNDKEQITYQIESSKYQLQAAKDEVKSQEKNIKQMEEVQQILKSKFTNEQLYQWMVSRLSSLFFQTYQLALDISKQAEQAWNFEKGVERNFIKGNYWDGLYDGLLSGESLMLSLNQMENAYMQENKRRLEIQKTVSLNSLVEKPLKDLKEQGECIFNFSESLFDADYAGMYNRQITSITVTIPAVVGPYENIKATLTQLRNATILKPDIEAVKYLNNIEEGDNKNIREDIQVNQQIAISTGVNDSGMFSLNFNDERYLPFEGTGAVSTWMLVINNDKTIRDNISDVIVQINYTALQGSLAFEKEVSEINNNETEGKVV